MVFLYTLVPKGKGLNCNIPSLPFCIACLTFQLYVNTIVEMKVLHTSDIHISKEHTERFDALLKVVDKAKEVGADFLIIAGDLFDDFDSAMENSVKLRSVFSGLPFKVIVAPGNHDYLIFDSSRDFGEDAIVLYGEQNVYEYAEKKVCFFTIPYASNVQTSSFIERLARASSRLSSDFINILIYHGDLEEVVQKVRFRRELVGQEKEGAFSINLTVLRNFPQIRLVLAGHYHNAGDPFEIAEGKGRYFAFSGSPVSITRNDLGPRSLLGFEVSDLREISFSRIPLESFYYEKLEVYLTGVEPDPLMRVREKIEEKIQESSNNLILLSVSGYINSSLANCSESELRNRIVSLTDETWKGRVVEDGEWFKVQDVSLLMEKPFTRSIMEKIEATNELSLVEKEKLKDWFIDVLGKVYSSKKGRV